MVIESVTEMAQNTEKLDVCWWFCSQDLWITRLENRTTNRRQTSLSIMCHFCHTFSYHSCPLSGSLTGVVMHILYGQQS